MLPLGVSGDRLIATVGSENNDFRIPQQNLLQIHFVAKSAGEYIRNDGKIAAHHVDGFAMKRAFRNDIHTFIAQTVQQTLSCVVCIYLLHHDRDGFISFFTPLG